MKELALKLPGDNNFVPGPPDFRFNEATNGSLGYIVSQALEVVFIVAAFLVFIWSLYGIIQYILAGGNKEGLAKARNRITWAFIGFIFLLISFALSQYVQQIYPLNLPNVKTITPPADLQAPDLTPPQGNNSNTNTNTNQPAQNPPANIPGLPDLAPNERGLLN